MILNHLPPDWAIEENRLAFDIVPSRKSLYWNFANETADFTSKELRADRDIQSVTQEAVMLALANETQEGVLERRRHERLDGVFNVRYIPLSKELAHSMAEAAMEMGLQGEVLPEVSANADGVHRAVTTNVSINGFCLLSERNLEMGSHLLVDINLPGLPRPVRALTTVVRILPAPSNTTLARYGLRIVAIHPEGLVRLRLLVDTANTLPA